MALTISFEGYVNEIKQFTWGRVARISHSQRAKNEATGEWENVGYDYLDVTLPDDVDVQEKSVVSVSGTLKATAYTSNSGEAKPSLKVRAQYVAPVERKQQDNRTNLNTLMAGIGASPIDDEDAPF